MIKITNTERKGGRGLAAASTTPPAAPYTPRPA
jgi:hypothetical protein